MSGIWHLLTRYAARDIDVGVSFDLGIWGLCVAWSFSVELSTLLLIDMKPSLLRIIGFVAVHQIEPTSCLPRLARIAQPVSSDQLIVWNVIPYSMQWHSIFWESSLIIWGTNAGSISRAFVSQSLHEAFTRISLYLKPTRLIKTCLRFTCRPSQAYGSPRYVPNTQLLRQEESQNIPKHDRSLSRNRSVSFVTLFPILNHSYFDSRPTATQPGSFDLCQPSPPKNHVPSPPFGRLTWCHTVC